jgi:aerobic carbon-monoxide dehydrogenase large subunit
VTLGASRYIGQSIKRREDPRFLTGRTRYVDDVRLPHTVHAAFVRSPHPRARILSVDTAAARALPGVLLVVTGQDIADVVRPIRGDLLFDDWQGADYHVLAWPEARFVGEAVAVVVAVDRYTAEDGADLVEIAYEPLPPVVHMEQAVQSSEPRVHQGWKNNLYFERRGTYGDVEGAFAAAEFVLERTYQTQRHTGHPMEMRACLADYNSASEALTLYTSTQIPHLIRTGLADALGHPENAVRVVAHDVGGGFGIKAHLFPEEVVIPYLAKRLCRPVKWVEDTREHLSASVHAREHQHVLQVAARRDGTILGIKADVMVDAGAYSNWPMTAAAEAGIASNMIPGPYHVPAYQVHTRVVASNKCPLGAYRGVGRPPACFSIERAMDDLSRELGLDPVDVRFRNLVKDDAYPYTSVVGMVYDSASMEASLRKAIDAVGYDAFRNTQRDEWEQGRYRGIGLGLYIEQSAHTTQEFIRRGIPVNFGYDTVRVRMDPSGTVLVDSSLHSHGQGHETTLAQVVAERLGVRLSDVRVAFGDTDTAPYGMGTFASRSAVLGGGAGWKAAGEVRMALLGVAGALMEVAPGDLDVEEGVITVKGAPHRQMTVAEVSRLVHFRPEKLPKGIMPADFESTQNYDADPGTGTWATGVHVAVVEVDPRTGGVRVERYLVVEDCGRMINPLIIDGQVHGGVAQGIGGALLEHLVYDDGGQLLSTTLMDYLLPTAHDVPRIEVLHHVTLSPFTINGIKGMGEGGNIAPGAAIANAVSDALSPLGVSVDRLPLSPARVLDLIERGRAETGGVAGGHA